MSDKARVIRECIEHLKGQPGRNAVRALKRLLIEQPNAVDVAPSVCQHEDMIVKVWKLNGGEDYDGMASRCQGAMFAADLFGHRAEGDDYALLYLLARGMAWDAKQ
jgi:hypothetical protein